MVTIEKNGARTKVPFGAFKNSFEKNGWKIVDGSKKKSNSQPNVNTKGEDKTSSEASVESTKAFNVDDEWDAADKELELEKSVDEMDMNELKRFAESKGIDVKDLKTVGALKKAIKSAM